MQERKPSTSRKDCIGPRAVTVTCQHAHRHSRGTTMQVAAAFNQVYNLKLSKRGLMEYAYRGERLTPSHCGRMDQACAFGSTPVSITYDGDILHVERATLGAPLHFVLVDLRASKDTVVILHALQAAYPVPSAPAHAAMHDLLGPRNARVCARALKLLEAGDAVGLGQLMCAAQADFDLIAAPLCPAQLLAPKLHEVLNCKAIAGLVLGGKGVGSGGDGTAQLLCRDAASQQEVCAVLEGLFDVHCLPMTLDRTE